MDVNITLMIREAQLAESQLHSPHYLKSVTAVGDRQRVYAIRDIYSGSGVKLLNAGAFVNSSIYERLLHHKLIPRLDECLAAEDSVSTQSLVEEATLLMGFDPGLLRMCAAMEDDGVLTDVLSRIPLTPVLAFKLTVMRSTRKELFQRSIYVTLVATYIGLQSGLDQPRLVQLATAALLHDIGILHVDPRMLELSYRMSEAERQHLYAHPITAWMILRDAPEYSDEVAEAVLQHHERLDGSGYPQGLRGEDVGQFGQIIALAEIVASQFGKDDAHHHLLRLETILKLNARRYGRHLIGHLAIFYSEEAALPPVTDDDRRKIVRDLNVIAEILAAWESGRERFPGAPAGDFVNERMQALKMEALDAGLNPYAVENNMLGIEHDPRALAEMRILLDEILWQVKGILHELRRRWPKIEETEQFPAAGEIRGWMSGVENLLNSPA